MAREFPPIRTATFGPLLVARLKPGADLTSTREPLVLPNSLAHSFAHSGGGGGGAERQQGGTRTHASRPSFISPSVSSTVSPSLMSLRHRRKNGSIDQTSPALQVT